MHLLTLLHRHRLLVVRKVKGSTVACLDQVVLDCTLTIKDGADLLKCDPRCLGIAEIHHNDAYVPER